jgi:NAD(P)-dependent dehydrogenase (short-subunit alcohol dehydrogenase family)
MAAADALGGVDVLFNNAGIDPLHATTVPGTSEEDFDRVMRVNVRSVFVFCRAAIPHFERRGGGVIVNTASIAGLMACPAEAAYTTSKAAVVNLTRAIALDHAAKGIRANVLCPGVLEGVMVDRRREMTDDQIQRRHASETGSPMRRAGTYEEVAKAVLFLASSDSSYCNGTALAVDGGMISGYSGHGTTVWSLAG